MFFYKFFISILRNVKKKQQKKTQKKLHGLSIQTPKRYNQQKNKTIFEHIPKKIAILVLPDFNHKIIKESFQNNKKKMAESGSEKKITITVKTPKEKQTIEVDENAEIKDVSFNNFFIKFLFKDFMKNDDENWSQ